MMTEIIREITVIKKTYGITRQKVLSWAKRAKSQRV